LISRAVAANLEFRWKALVQRWTAPCRPVPSNSQALLEPVVHAYGQRLNVAADAEPIGVGSKKVGIHTPGIQLEIIVLKLCGPLRRKGVFHAGAQQPAAVCVRRAYLGA